MKLVYFFKRLLRNYRIKRFRCPYCNAPQYNARYLIMSDSPIAGSAIFCKQMHHGFIYEPTHDPYTFNYKQLDGGGEPINIPNLTMTWGNIITKPSRWR